LTLKKGDMFFGREYKSKENRNGKTKGEIIKKKKKKKVFQKYIFD